jgi:two-component system phosphate regulon sensor histidine kinase PhoR
LILWFFERANEIKDEVVIAIKDNSFANLKELHSIYRISIVNKYGIVIYDNFSSNLDNHSDRFEIKSAMQNENLKAFATQIHF